MRPLRHAMVIALASCGPDDGASDASDIATDTGVAADTATDVAADTEPPPDTTATDTAPETVADTVVADVVTPLEVEWTSCVDPEKPPPPKHGCAQFELPLDAADASKGIIRVSVDRRIAPEDDPPIAQVFMLGGGPGIPSYAQMAAAQASFAGRPGAWRDVYRIDQRGVAGPDALPDCPELRENYIDEATTRAAGEACAARLDPDVVANVSAAAQGRDVGAIIASLRDPSLPAFVYGTSYGTRWALRYLQQIPDQVDGVILDSLLAEGADWLAGYHVNRDAQMRWLLEACGADDLCSSKLGADPVQRLKDLIVKTDGGHCPTSAGLDGSDYRNMFHQIYAAGFSGPSAPGRALLAPLVYRVDRCAPGDEAVILAVHERLGGTGGVSNVNVAHNAVVVLSELFPDPPPTGEALAAIEAGFLSGSGDLISGRALWEVMPRYPRDAFQGHYPETSMPILMLHGTRDGNTAYSGAEEVAAALDGPHQTLVTFPDATHGIVAGTPIAGTFDDCGFEIVEQFLADPTATLDTDCVDDVEPLDFELGEWSERVFGTADAWEDQ